MKRILTADYNLSLIPETTKRECKIKSTELFEQSFSKTINYSELKLVCKKNTGIESDVFEGKYNQETVAIKIFKTVKDNEEKQKFLYEAYLMSNFDSQYLVKFRGITYDSKYSIIMEYCSGGTLREFLDSEKELTPLKQIDWAKQISYGVSYLHTAGIIHRDLKCENIFLSIENTIKLGDFGLSVNTTFLPELKEGEEAESVAGTIPWMSPEVLSLKLPTIKSDIYSLGIVLYEIISREYPYHMLREGEIVKKIVSGIFPTIKSQWPRVFKEMMLACWNRDCDSRPTAIQIGQAFECALRSTQTLSKPLAPSMNPHILMPKPVKKALPETKCDPTEVIKLLSLVAQDEQIQVEQMIRHNSTLLLATGTVTDPAERIFKKISPYQYAVWSLNWHLLEVMDLYITIEQRIEQITVLEQSGTEHGTYFSLQPLIESLKIYIDKSEKEWKYDKRAVEHWSKIIGGWQRQLPMNFIFEYCREDQSFYPNPVFNVKLLPQSRILKYSIYKNWHTFKYSGGVCGDTFAYYKGLRGKNSKVLCSTWVASSVAASDLKAVQLLWKTRLNQLEIRKTKLLTNPQQIAPS